MHTSSDTFLPDDSPAHLLEVMEIQSEPLITLLAQASQLPVYSKKKHSSSLKEHNG